MNMQLMAYGLLGFLLWSGGFGTLAYLQGKHQCQIEQRAEQAKQVDSTLQTREKNENESNQNAQTVIKQVETIRWKTRNVVRQVPVYITPVADRGCVINSGFVRLHNLSASGLPDDPNTSSQPDDAASGVALSTVGETVVENYGSCRAEMIRFEGLQNWVAKYCR